MMKAKDQIWYGGDYNPDQWEEEIWDVDFDLFQKAHVNILTLPVFSWSRIQKDEDHYDFDWLIKIIEKAKALDIAVCLATSTAVQPAWLSKKHPEILPVDAYGRQRRFGGRVNFCPNSAAYKKAAKELVRRMAIETKAFDNIVMWHIGNEYDNYCYCDTCKTAFQSWVKEKYHTIEEVNRKWYLNFWGHQIYEFDDIEIPDFRSENWEMAGIERTNFQTILLDYKRFMNDSILSCYLNELEVIREITPDIPITTNFMGAFKPLDYFKWAKHLDVISWDHYPGLNEPPYKSALLHDLMRSLKKESPFWLMEQSPSQQNWAPYNTLKRPGELRLQSYQTMARGADAIMYFQMRRSLANCEKFHGALIDHVGNSETRVFKECQEIGQELLGLKEIIGSQVKARVAMVFDWENWWAIEMSSGPSIALNYMEVMTKFYESIYVQQEMIDFINEDDDLSGYDVIYAPLLYMVKDPLFNKIETYVKNGGTLVLTTFSGIVDENDHVTTKGYPGKFREMAGIWVEEIDGLLPEMTNSIEGYKDQSYTCQLLCDIIHEESAEVLGTYGSDFYKGKPVLTRNKWGNGMVYYIGTIPEQALLNDLAEDLIGGKTCTPLVEKSTRYHGETQYDFYINYGDEKVALALDGEWMDLLHQEKITEVLHLKQKDAMIMKKL